MKRFMQIARKVGLSGRYFLSLSNERSFVGGTFVGTKWDITAPMLAEYLERTPNAKEMRELTQREAYNLLYERYWLDLGLSNLDHKDVATLIYLGLRSLGTASMRENIMITCDRLNREVKNYEVFTSKGIVALNSVNQEAFFRILRLRLKWRYTRMANTNKRKKYLKLLSGITFVKKAKPSKRIRKNNPKLSISHRIPESVRLQLNKLKGKTR